MYFYSFFFYEMEIKSYIFVYVMYVNKDDYRLEGNGDLVSNPLLQYYVVVLKSTKAVDTLAS